jgi:IS66 C-terminal element
LRTAGTAGGTDKRPLPRVPGSGHYEVASDGGAHHWALVASLVATAKLNGVETLAWLTDVLERMVSGRTKAHELEKLLPWAWKAERLAAAVHA